MERHLLAFAATILSCAGQNAAAVNVAPPEVWIIAGLRIDHPAPGWEDVRTDAGDMWKPNAPWTTVASNVRVVGFVLPNLERVTDDAVIPSSVSILTSRRALIRILQF